MKYFKLICLVLIISSSACGGMEKRHAERKEMPISFFRSPTGKKHRWADPKDLQHGFYLATVDSEIDSPIRISSMDIAIRDTDGNTDVAIADSYNPLEVITHAGRLHSRGTGIPYEQAALKKVGQEAESLEAVCLRIEYLLRSDITRYIVIFRTLNSQKCKVATHIDDIHEHSQTTEELTQYLDKKKVVTRVFLDIFDERLENVRVRTKTFTCD